MKKKLIVKNRLWAVRRIKGLTQTQLADKCGTTRFTISGIERNKFEPSIKLVLIICTVLDVKIEDVFYLSVTEEERKNNAFKWLEENVGDLL